MPQTSIPEPSLPEESIPLKTVPQSQAGYSKGASGLFYEREPCSPSRGFLYGLCSFVQHCRVQYCTVLPCIDHTPHEPRVPRRGGRWEAGEKGRCPVIGARREGV